MLRLARQALRTPVPLVALLSLVLGSSLLVAGCGGKSSGSQVGPNQVSNLEVRNDGAKTLHVYASGLEIGEVFPGATAAFFVTEGFRTIEFRERGDSFRQEQGQFSFNTFDVLRLVYNPALSFNLEVHNNRVDTVHVIVDNDDLGSVIPNGVATFSVRSGRRDVFFRRTGQSTAEFWGTFNFNTTTAVDITYQ